MPKPFRAFVRKLLPLAAGRACPICARRTERVHTPWYYRPLRWMVRGQSGTRYCYRCRVRWFAFGASGRDIEESPVLKVRPRLFERKPANVARFPVPQGKPPEKKLDAIQLLSVLRDALATLEAELTGAKSVPTPKAKDAEDRSIMH